MQVVLYHYFFLPFRPETWFKYTERALVAWDGMNLFFTLSGYLIGGILLSAKGREGMMKVFYARRFFRIIPLYALLLVSYWVVRLVDEHYRFGLIYAWYSDIPFWTYLTFSQNIWIVQHQGLGALWLMVTWSLAVEQQFYLITPWLVRWLRTAGLIIVVVAAILAAALRSETPVADWLLFDRMDALGAGFLLAILASLSRVRDWMQRHRSLLRWVTGSYLLALMAAHVGGVLNDIHAVRSLTVLVFAMLIHLLTDDVPWPVLTRVLTWLAPLGALSYFIYLFHYPILFLTGPLLYPSKQLALLLTIGFAVLSYRYIERPLIEYGHRFRYGERREPAAGA